MEAGIDSAKDVSGRIETADGTRFLLFRYDNPGAPNRNPNSMVSKDGLVGRWFTDSPETLATRILMRPPGGSIVVAEVPKDRLEQLRASNHPIAKEMDFEPLDNFILPDEMMEEVQTFPVTVPHENPRKFLFKEVGNIRNFVDTLIKQLKQAPQKNPDIITTWEL